MNCQFNLSASNEHVVFLNPNVAGKTRLTKSCWLVLQTWKKADFDEVTENFHGTCVVFFHTLTNELLSVERFWFVGFVADTLLRPSWFTEAGGAEVNVAALWTFSKEPVFFHSLFNTYETWGYIQVTSTVPLIIFVFVMFVLIERKR